jgi:hypothetical protein
MPKPARNRTWSEFSRPAPVAPTAFEEQVRELGLTEETCAQSEALRRWCERHKDRLFIPEWLLKKWRMTAEADLSG